MAVDPIEIYALREAAFGNEDALAAYYAGKAAADWAKLTQDEKLEKLMAIWDRLDGDDLREECPG